MAIYTGSIYSGSTIFLHNSVPQVFNSKPDSINYFSNTGMVDNFKNNINNINYFSGSIYNGSSTTTINTIAITTSSVTSSGSLIVYYQRVFSSGLNDWSYYKTVGSINVTPLSSQTNPPWTGTILYHEVIGKLQS